MLKLRSQLLGFAFRSERETKLLIPLKRWLQLILGLATLISLATQRWWLAAVCALLFLLIGLLYRWAKRTGYTTFIPSASTDHPPASSPLSGTEKIPVQGTGRLLLGEAERRFILAPGTCWHLPIGDVAFMFEVAPERFAYQFIRPNTVESMRLGELWFAHSETPAIEVTFETNWIALDDQIEIKWRDSKDEPEKKTGRRTLVLSFEDMGAALRVWERLGGLGH